MPLAEFFRTRRQHGQSGGPCSHGGEVVGIVSTSSRIRRQRGPRLRGDAPDGARAAPGEESVWGGIDGTIADGELAEIFNVPGGVGYLVKTVAKNSPAWKAGVLGGDRTATIQGQEIVVRGDVISKSPGSGQERGGSGDDSRAARTMPPGTPMTFSVLRAARSSS